MEDRQRKLVQLEAAGVLAYPYQFASDDILSAIGIGDELGSGDRSGEIRQLSGRIRAKRGHGKILFVDIHENGNSIQVLLKEDEVDNYNLLEYIDIGDFIGVSGEIIKSSRGETTLLAREWTMLSKALRPLPDKFHGLKDQEIRSRQRELDMLSNPDTINTFKVRGRVISEIRKHLEGRDFLEVETPVLQSNYGGALARPFKTHHNSLDQEMYLRIASELYLKRCMVGGINRVFEIGKDFRNEGLSPKHNPEFTMLEYYEAYADYNKMAEDFENMVSAVVSNATGGSRVGDIDFSDKWRRISFRDAILNKIGIDVLADSAEADMAEFLGEAGLGFAEMADKIFSSEVEPGLISPTFVFDYPIEMSPFAKAHRENPRLTERWEAFVGGREIANAFSELNDPREQKKRFLDQAKGPEAQPYDESFIRSLEYGMPPAGGVGLGIDRLVMIITGKENLREVILFPTMKTVGE